MPHRLTRPGLQEGSDLAIRVMGAVHQPEDQGRDIRVQLGTFGCAYEGNSFQPHPRSLGEVRNRPSSLLC
eukprot:SAG11_NODE_300_length_11057_cov_5.223469_13_plen_70_part_00